MPAAFFDDFKGPAGSLPDPAKWRFKLGPHGSELQCYDTAHAVLDGNTSLVITAEKTPTVYNGTTYQYASSWIETAGTVEPFYGLIEARMQMPAGRGLWPAFWMVGNDHDEPDHFWPRCGEVDVTEVLGHDLATTYATLHGPKTDGSHWQQLAGGRVVPRSWSDLAKLPNVYGCLWERGRFRFLLNGVVVADFKETDTFLPVGHVWVFDHPFWMILNLAVGGWAGAPDASTVFPAKLIVDWVRYTPLPI